MKILFADDHSLFRKGFIANFATHYPEIEFQEAVDGLQAWELLQSTPFDIILLDIRMPKLDGVKLLARIKTSKPNARVIMLTQYDEPSLICQCLQLGANAFLLKTTEIEDVSYAINKVHTEGYYFDDRVNKVIDMQLNGTKEWANLDITPRELQVLAHLADGEITTTIAAKLELSVLTVEGYRKSLLHKTKSGNVAELVSLGYKTGILVSGQ